MINTIWGNHKSNACCGPAVECTNTNIYMHILRVYVDFRTRKMCVGIGQPPLGPSYKQTISHTFSIYSVVLCVSVWRCCYMELIFLVFWGVLYLWICIIVDSNNLHINTKARRCVSRPHFCVVCDSNRFSSRTFQHMKHACDIHTHTVVAETLRRREVRHDPTPSNLLPQTLAQQRRAPLRPAFAVAHRVASKQRAL